MKIIIMKTALIVLFFSATMLIGYDIKAENCTMNVVFVTSMVLITLILFLLINFEKWVFVWYPAIKDTFKVTNKVQKPKFKTGDCVRMTKKFSRVNSYLNNIELTVQKVSKTIPYGYYLTGKHNGNLLKFIVQEKDLEYV